MVSHLDASIASPPPTGAAATPRVRIRTIDDVWPELESGLQRLMSNLNEGFPQKHWMTLYT